MAIQSGLPIRNQFEEAVRNLLSLIEPLLISVKDCAEVVEQINELADRRDREQRAVNELERTGTLRGLSHRKKQLNSLSEKINKLHSPFSNTEKGIHKFLRNLKTVLSAVPMEPAQLLNLRAEIERLAIWEDARDRNLGMRSSVDDLGAVKQRLGEMLSCLAKKQEPVESSLSSSDRAAVAPPEGSRRRERGPDIETSRKRIELEELLTTELTTIAQRAKKFTTLSELRHRYPDFTLWNRLPEQEQKELLTHPFRPKVYARSLVLRKYGITSDALKKDRQKLRRATR